MMKKLDDLMYSISFTFSNTCTYLVNKMHIVYRYYYATIYKTTISVGIL